MNTYNHYLKQSIAAGNDVASLGWLLTSHNKGLVPAEELLWNAIEKNRAVVVTEWTELFPDMFCGLSVQKIFDCVYTPEMAFALAQSPIDWEEEIDHNGVVTPLGDVWMERFPFLHDQLAHQRLPADIIEKARKRYETISAQLAPFEQTVLEVSTTEEHKGNSTTVLPPHEIEDHRDFMNSFKRTDD